MSRFRKRLDDIEDRKAFRQFIDEHREFAGRSCEELLFFSAHGYFPKSTGNELPERQEFTVSGIRTIITAEWVKLEERHK